jgi:hypothetical protein
MDINKRFREELNCYKSPKFPDMFWEIFPFPEVKDDDRRNKEPHMEIWGPGLNKTVQSILNRLD